MIRTSVFAIALIVSASSPETAVVEPSTAPSTWTGWFSDKGCAASKIKSGDISPNGTVCVKKCLNDGATPVFISEQAKAMYEVKDHPSLIDDVGYRVELTGVVDEDAKTISVQSVKRLSEVVQMCGRKKDKR
jgi:hypothetical protein